MKLIRFDSIHGMTEADCPDLGEYRKWQNGEEKQVPDDVAALALTNPNFVEVSASDTSSNKHTDEEE